MKVFVCEDNNMIGRYFSAISGFDDFTVFQSEYFYEIYKHGGKVYPKVIVCTDDDTVKGFMLVQFQNYFHRIFDRFAKRAILIGAPVFNGDVKVLDLLLGFYTSVYKNDVIYTQVRNIYSRMDYLSTFEKYNFRYIDHLNYLIDLKTDINIIWDNIYSKRKNEIRKGLKEKVKVREINYSLDMVKSYSIIKNIYNKVKLPLPDINYFQRAYQLSETKNIFRIFGGYYEDELIGVIYLLCFNGRVYNWYAASNPDYYKKYPNDVIMWEVIKWASENGYSLFDFGGAGNPNKSYGVRDFKKKFGGVEVNYGRFERIHKKNTMKLAEFGFKIWQKVK